MHLKTFLLFVVLVVATTSFAQEVNPNYAGTYGDWMLNGGSLSTELDLREDGTFTLKYTDPVYPLTFDIYTNEGKWITFDDRVILNPDLEPRKARVELSERQIDLEDSIQIEINHFVEYYQNEEFLKIEESNFDILTVYFDKPRKYLNLTRDWFSMGTCVWAPRLKNRINLDSTNTFRIAKKDFQTLGIRTFGFEDFIQVEVSDPNNNQFVIDVIVPVDLNRMPRSKQILIKGDKAFIYEYNGKIRKSLNPLYRRKQNEKTTD